MELRDLYDENKNVTGLTFVKGEQVPKGYYYLIVAIYIQNNKGEFLVQKRVPRKGGKWASIDEIKKMKENDEFHEGHYIMFEKCLNYLNEV